MNKTETKNLKIGFIGCGKMASAIIGGIINSNFTNKNNISASEAQEDFAQKKSEELGINVVCNNSEVADLG